MTNPLTPAKPAYNGLTPGGRPPKINQDIIKRIADHIEQGSYADTASALAGISRSTFHQWAKRGARAILAREEGKEVMESEYLYVAFSDAIQKAEAQYQSTALTAITKAKSWQAAAWRLERRFPDKYALRPPVQQQGAELAVSIKVTIMDDQPAIEDVSPAIDIDYEPLKDE